ncbi:MAG: hypothetical protein H2172_08610 [Opitutus sp.]|nr:hypothetical protein [Opitutus sp.]MCS6246959.1 hypothetical protein [Opitutus sp.]MCS6272783.1 hypothetical protein [Opitutus sp.]
MRSFDAFDELDDLPDVTSLTVAVNGDPAEPISKNPEYDNIFKRRQSWTTLAEMLVERPIGATYTHTLGGTPSGVVTITAPNTPYEQAAPINPLFTITGATGSWSLNEIGQGVFSFDPSSVNESFTVTMNSYGLRAEGVQGGHFAYGLFVAHLNNGFNPIDELHSGLRASGDPITEFSLTFYKNRGLEGDDGDASTYGFSTGTSFELEGEFVNIFGLDNAGTGALEAHDKAFIYQTVTSLVLTAQPVPEPAAAAQIFGALGLGFALMRRPSRPKHPFGRS